MNYKKNKKKKICYTNMSARIPLIESFVVFLILERFNASGFLYGVFGLIYIIFIINGLYGFFTEERIVFDLDKEYDENLLEQMLNKFRNNGKTKRK